MIKTPELNKIMKVKSDSQTISGFFKWLSEQSIVLAEFDTKNCEDCNSRCKQEGLVHTRSSREQLLADYFGIDLAKTETEKQALLDDIRAKNEESEMNEFSKGEWRRTGLVVTICGKGIIAKCPKPQAGGVFECADNAKLIAAAPKLLGACEIAVLAMTHEPINPDDIRFIQAVIAVVKETK